MVRLQLFAFLDASSHLYKRPCPSVGPSVGPSVRRSVRRSVTLSSKSMKNGLLRTINDFDSSLESFHFYKRPFSSIGTSDKVE